MPYLNSNSQTIVGKVALNSFKEMVPDFQFNFSIFREKLLTSMVSMGVEVMTCNEIYDDGVKVRARISVPQ